MTRRSPRDSRHRRALGRRFLVETVRGYAELRRELKTAGAPIPSNDTWIAALAREHRLPVVTRDVHFQAIPNQKLATW